MFRKNEGAADRALRISFGVVFVGLGLTFPVLKMTGLLVLGAVGLVLLATGLSGICPLYSLVKFDTGVPPEGQLQG